MVAYRKMFYTLLALPSMLLLGQNNASAAFTSTWELTNNTGGKVSDFHAIFTGTGGSIGNAAIIANGGPGAATITGSSNTIDIVWAADYFDNNKKITFKFDTDFAGIAFNSGNWTFDNIPGGGNPIPVSENAIRPVPLPASLLMFAPAVAGLLAFRRKAASPTTGLSA